MNFSKPKIIYSSKFKKIILAILTGILVGIVVSAFRFFIEHLLEFIKNNYHKHLLAIIILFILFLMINYFLIKSEPDIKGSGIPQIEAQLNGQLAMDWFGVLWKKFVGGVLAIGSGLFLGREGPSIQLGGVIGLGIWGGLGFSKTDQKILISNGASAGLAAAFNAPVAGVLFILEEIHHNFSPIILVTSFVSSLTANYISLNVFGLKPILQMVKDLPYIQPNQYIWVIFFGIFLGLFAKLYEVVLINLPLIPLWIPFVLLIPIGYFYTDLLGGGNSIILNLNKNNYTLLVIFGVLILRFVFSMISYGSGLPGGIFLPTLSLGAISGMLLSKVAIVFGLLPNSIIVSFIVISMSGLFGAISMAPLTSIVLVTEMVGSLHHLMPLALITITSYLIMDVFRGRPIYDLLTEKLINKN
ncbi:MAG: ClC family H(+)/Cl(-) exchange transporter [Lactobacillaceae bacterium]|nr:ClC family H(+)/Cl(-) exchange transporter [Lactobacillaceae bacterium]